MAFTTSIRRQCDGGCGRTLPRYDLCEDCERAMRNPQPIHNFCGVCGSRLVRDPNGRTVWHVCTDGHIKVAKA